MSKPSFSTAATRPSVCRETNATNANESNMSATAGKSDTMRRLELVLFPAPAQPLEWRYG